MINKNITEKRKEAMFYILKNGESYATGLAEDTDNDRANMTRILNELEEINILENSNNGRREKFFDLTETGREMAFFLKQVERLKEEL